VVRVNAKITLAIVAGFMVGALSAYALRMAERQQATAIPGGVLRAKGEAEIGGAFLLTDQDGRPFSEAQLRGKPSLIVFGSTTSLDLTPAALNTVSQALEQLGSKAEGIRIVFIALDWERDRPEVVKAYLERFHPGIIGLSGNEAEVRKAAQAFKIFVEWRTTADGGSEISHSEIMYALDADGGYVSHLRVPSSVTAVMSLLRSLIA